MALVKAQGAHHVLNHREADYLQQLPTLIGGRGVDVVLEMLATSTWTATSTSWHPGAVWS